jgi:hypothetical protein
MDGWRDQPKYSPPTAASNVDDRRERRPDRDDDRRPPRNPRPARDDDKDWEQPCKFFASPAGCRRGTECRYQHVEGAKSSSDNRRPPRQLRDDDRPPRRFDESEDRPPRRFSEQDDRRARRPAGDGDGPRSRPSRDDDKDWEQPCKFFASPVGCRRGAECRYQHIEGAPALRQQRRTNERPNDRGDRGDRDRVERDRGERDRGERDRGYRDASRRKDRAPAPRK